MRSRKNPTLPHLSLILPVYNEPHRLQAGLKLAVNYLKKQSYSWEVIVVDDGSTDTSTSNWWSGISRNSPEVKLIRTARNFGKGHAIRLGVAVGRGDYIIFSDIDFSVAITYLPQFLSALKKSDMAIGSRRLSASRITQHQPLLREYLGRGFTQLSNWILGLNHSDLTCGFKAFRSKPAKDLFSHQQLNRWAFDAEILFLAKKFHYRVTEIPVTWHNNPFTKVNLFKDTITSLISLAQIRLIHL